MWSTISRVGQLLGLVSSEPRVDVDAIAAVLDAEDNVSDEGEEVMRLTDNATGDSVVCQHRVGVIASLFDTHGFIKSSEQETETSSSLLYFKREGCSVSVEVGDRVVYLAFRTSSETDWIVRKILYKERELWDKKGDGEEEDRDCNQSVVKEECETAYKHVIAKVTGREGRTVLAGELQFCLDTVKVDFIPVEGDWVVLQSLVQTEQRADTLLVVHRVSPLRCQQLEGSVSHWSAESHHGIVDNAMVFSKEVCEPGYLPRVGDKVRVQSIESEQGQLMWRAVHVLPTFSQQPEISHDPQALAALLQDKQGIVVSEDTNCGTLNIGKETEIKIEARNTSDVPHCLLDVELTSRETQFTMVQPVTFQNIFLHPRQSLHFTFKVKGRFLGRSTELVVFKFEGFEIGRHLAIDVQSASVTASLNESRHKRNQHKQEPITAKKFLATRNGFILPGVRPIKPPSFVPVNLGMFVIPNHLVEAVLGTEHSRKEDLIQCLVVQNRVLGEPLSAQNYVVRWDTLIHLEDLESQVNIARYNTTAALRRIEDYLSLEILGLAERRPSLLVGDKVVVREAWSDENSWEVCGSIGYEGYIHKVLSNEVLIKFTPSFHDSCNGVYLVCFEPSRTSYRRQHQAVHVAFKNLSADWLFPSRVVYQPPQVVISYEEDYLSPMDRKSHTNNKPPEVSKADNINCDEDNSIINVNYGDILAVPEHKTETLNAKHNVPLNSKDLVLIEKSEDDIVNTATNIQNGEETSTKQNQGVRRSKNKVSDMFEKIIPKEDALQKISPPRVPVIARFLESEKSIFTEKSPKEVKNMLQRLATLSSSEAIPSNKQSMKTLEEVENSLLNGSGHQSILNGIKPLPQTKDSLPLENQVMSPFEQFLKLNDLVTNQSETTNNSFIQNENSPVSDNKLKNKKDSTKEKIMKNNLNKSTKDIEHGRNKIKWNSNVDLKVGNEQEGNSIIPCLKRKKIEWFNPLLNHYQKEAIRNILRGEARPLPYVIFGPPGTGKTITLVEAILQIYFQIPESRLLIGTPSNSSADLICERLLDSGLLAPGDLLRLVGFNYAEQGRISDKLRPFCGSADINNRDDSRKTQKAQGEQAKKEGVVNMSRHAIGRHRITVGTCNTLGVLYQMGFPRGHFTHVMLDEAGQATEPEILIPLAFLHSSCGQAVLAGDPLQLGPVVISKVAEHFGLGESLMSRLLLRVPYCRDLAGFSDTCGYNPRLVTRLVFNYRSLPEILDLPNQMFYDGDLIPKVSEDDSEEAGVLNRLRAVLPARPLSQPPALVFHGVRGTNCQAPDSPSWHNPHEAVQAAMYLQGLYSSGLSADQCGIITPYQAQVLKIRHMLETLEIPIPKVGSVEEFQGQERMAVILSTVRSSPRLLEADVRHTIGFIASPRRLNVAITRARAVLIIVGNPHLLARDQYWRTVLECCVRNGAYTGCDLPTLSVGNTDNKPEEKN